MFEELKELMREEMQLDESLDITPDSELVKDLGINSIELADMVLLCEDRFGISIPDEEISKLQTVQDVADYLEKHKEDK